MTSLTVLATGPLATVQDHGRPGYADLGVPGSGGADRGALALANRLVGNAEWAAVVETTMGGFRARVDADALVAVTGADTVVRHNGVPAGLAAARSAAMRWSRLSTVAWIFGTISLPMPKYTAPNVMSSQKIWDA